MALSTDLLRLDLACGKTPKEGFEGVDLFEPTAKWRVDLLSLPWPWQTSQVDELHCSHFLEHVPAENRNGQDLLVAIMDEAWRVLKPGGVFTIVVPCARSNRAFQDPTHRRFFVAESFLYYAKAWRDANGLGHYLGKCDFSIEVNHSMPNEIALLHPEAQQRRFNESWNSIYDWHARLVAQK